MLRFDDFRLDPATLHIFRKDIRLDAPPQVVEVLAYLIANGDRIIPRDELLDRFWPRAGTGGDAALNTCIRRIRALLEEDAEAPRYIWTRPRSGYRFIGTVDSGTVDSSTVDSSTVDSSTPDNGSLDNGSLVGSTMPPPHRRFDRRVLVGGLLAAAAVCAAVWVHGATHPPRHRIAVEPVQGLCEYALFPNFNAGLRESFMARISHTLPAGYSVAADGSNADLHARISVRQTPEQTVVVLTLTDDGDGRIVWSREFSEATDMDDYVPLQRSLAQRMAASLMGALDKRS